MAPSSTPTPPPVFTHTSSRRILRLNHYIGLILILFIFLAVNGISYKHFYRKNLSNNPYTQLGSQTLGIIGSLPAPVTITNFVSGQGGDGSEMIASDVDKVLDEYRFRSNGKVEVRRVNPYTNFSEARAIATEQKITTDENVLIIQYKDQTKVLNYRELAEIDNSGAFMGGAPRLIAFKAEEAVTSAIQALVAGAKSNVYFLTGHGEYNTDSADNEPAGYSRLAAQVRRQNAELRKLNLAQTPEIPADAELLVIAGPRQPYTAVEVEILKAYLARAEKPGRLLLLLDPLVVTGLENLLAGYGVVFNPDIATTRISVLGQARLLMEGIATTFSDHPVTNWLVKSQNNITLGPTRSLTVKKPDNLAEGQVVALAMTPEAYWGESQPQTKPVQFDANADRPGPLTLAAAIDLGRVTGGDMKVKGAKVFAVGGGEFLTNQMISGNQLDFFLNGFNWLLDKENSLGISPKAPKEFRVALDENQRKQFLLITLVAVPLAAAFLGFLVWYRRR
ncbi:MAG: GldG family protein [Candidatus Methylacidiphilales bacterium]|nr:GldG family protein [Candidatus Methylacidiphilales bacterium]